MTVSMAATRLNFSLLLFNLWQHGLAGNITGCINEVNQRQAQLVW